MKSRVLMDILFSLAGNKLYLQDDMFSDAIQGYNKRVC